MTGDRDTLRIFFEAVFPVGAAGYLHIALFKGGHFNERGKYEHTGPPELKAWHYPDQLGDAIDWTLDARHRGDVYFAPTLMLTGDKLGRRKDNIIGNWQAHVDGDKGVDPYEVRDLGGCTVLTGSPGHGHAHFPFAEEITAEQRAELATKLRTRFDGDDKIAANDLLRPPCTLNWKSGAPRFPATERTGAPAETRLAEPFEPTRVKPYALARVIGADMSVTTAAAPATTTSTNGGTSDMQPIDLDDYPTVKMAFDTRTEPPDRSKDTVRIIGAAIDVGLTIDQARAILNQRPDLAGRLNGRTDDDVARVWAKLKDERAAQVQEFKHGEWLLEWPGATGQLGMAYRLAKAYPNRLLHVHGIGWLYWDGTRWVRDDIGKANRAVYALFKWAWSVSKEDDADDEKTAKDKAGLRSTLVRCESSHGVDSILRLAQRLPAIAATANDLDLDPYALNTLDGIVDLRTGECSPHAPDARNTKQTGVGYDPAADCPRWKAFLNTTFGGSQELIDYVQRFLGYTAIGEVSRHILPFCHGAGDNGKTVLLEVVSAILGSYAITAPANFLLAGRDKHETEIARLCGARLVICSEVNRDSKFDEQKVKMLTGGDGLTGRFMRKDFFDFKPSHTLMLIGNHQPEVSAGGKSFWRRLHLVPFLHEVAPEERNENLTRELIEEEGAAILAWIVEGAQAFIAKGLDDPAVVTTATNAYAASEDHVQLFIDDCCDHRPLSEWVEFSEVYKRYAGWCKDNGVDKLASAVFGRELSGKGFGKDRTNSKRYVTGIWVSEPPKESKAPTTKAEFFDWTDKYET